MNLFVVVMEVVVFVMVEVMVAVLMAVVVIFFHTFINIQFILSNVAI